MRFLLHIAESTAWAKFSAGTFMTLFGFLILLVYRPAAKAQFEEEAKIVLQEDTPENQ